jgi:hypothetical protein
MLHVYFDTNVYDAIARGSLRPDEAKEIQSALARPGVIPFISLANVEELLGDWSRDREAARSRLRTARNLVGFDRMLKEPSVLLREAIEAYACGSAPSSLTLRRPERRRLATWLERLADGAVGSENVISDIVERVRQEKETFRAQMQQACDRAVAELSVKYDQRDLRQVRWEEYLAADAHLWAEALADHVGLGDACRRRGLAGLLEVRTIRLCVGVAKSLVYSQVVNRRRPDLGDGYDLWHVVLSSVADVFLTFDQRLAGHLERVPVNGFRVVTSVWWFRPILIARSGRS